MCVCWYTNYRCEVTDRTAKEIVRTGCRQVRENAGGAGDAGPGETRPVCQRSAHLRVPSVAVFPMATPSSVSTSPWIREPE